MERFIYTVSTIGSKFYRGELARIVVFKTVAMLFSFLPTASAAAVPSFSDFFSTAAEESFSTYQMSGDGDLWPSCWAADGNLYTANGDGNAFSGTPFRFDMAVSRIAGMPPQLTGTTVATNVGTNWSGHDYNRKPTGMLCLHGDLYLAFQNLNLRNFSDAPAASIARSADGGKRWTWDEKEPMFGTPANPKSPDAYKFTTIFFLDYGRDSARAPAAFVYAYGLDNNWREQDHLYLARVPKSSIQLRSSWQFYTGLDSGGRPAWSSDIGAKTPILTDERRLYPVVPDKGGCAANQPVISQGGVVYDAPLRRYIFASWSCATHELYEAPEPWGPWRLFLSKDFGRRSSTENRGQYGTNIPSKFLSQDGKTLWLQSNVCCGGNSYTYALRKIFVEPYLESVPANLPSNEDLAAAKGTRAISKSTRHGSLCGVDCYDVLTSGNINASEDDDDGELKREDWWGVIWPRAYHLNKFVYQAGPVSEKGGFFESDFHVQVRQRGEWRNVEGLSISPPYLSSRLLPAHAVTTFRFYATWGDGVRVVGTPGGEEHFTSAGQLGVYYDSGNLVDDGGFEYQISSSLSAVWRGEGTGPRGTTRFEQKGHSGVNNAWLANAGEAWNGVAQTVEIQPQTSYRLTAWVRSDLTGQTGRLGIREAGAKSTLAETEFGEASQYTKITTDFRSGEITKVELYIGFSGEKVSRSLQVDDVSLEKR